MPGANRKLAESKGGAENKGFEREAWAFKLVLQMHSRLGG